MEETLEPGASVAVIARSHGVNANQVFHWRRLYRETYSAVVADATAQLKAVYFECLGTTKAIEITLKNRDLLSQFERIATVRYAVGKGQQQDVLKAQVEQSGLAQQLEMLSQRKATAEARIRSLVGAEIALTRSTDVKLSPLTVSLDELLKSLPNQSPRLMSKQAIIDSRSVAIERSKKDYRPDFGAGFRKPERRSAITTWRPRK